MKTFPILVALCLGTAVSAPASRAADAPEKKAGDTGVTKPESKSEIAADVVKTPSAQQQQKTGRSEANPTEPKAWSADQDGKYDRYRYYYSKRYQAGSMQDFKSGNDERFKSYLDRDTPWQAATEADRDWQSSDYYWRETDRYWRDKSRRNDPKSEEYRRNSDEYWNERNENWQRADEGKSDKPTKAPEGQEIEGNQRVSN